MIARIHLGSTASGWEVQVGPQSCSGGLAFFRMSRRRLGLQCSNIQNANPSAVKHLTYTLPERHEAFGSRTLCSTPEAENKKLLKKAKRCNAPGRFQAEAPALDESFETRGSWDPLRAVVRAGKPRGPDTEAQELVTRWLQDAICRTLPRPGSMSSFPHV